MKFFKILIAAFLMLSISACEYINESVDIIISATSKTMYEASGSTSIHLTQTNAINPSEIKPFISGNKFVISLGACNYQYDITSIDQINADFWLNQSVSISLDKTMFKCNTKYQCWITQATSFNNNTAETGFECKEI